MDNNILTFCKNYLKKLDNAKKDIENSSINKTFNDDFLTKKSISFNLNMRESDFLISSKTELFKLDDEDLKYLYDKYSKRIKDELNANIESVKQKYEGLI